LPDNKERSTNDIKISASISEEATFGRRLLPLICVANEPDPIYPETRTRGTSPTGNEDVIAAFQSSPVLGSMIPLRLSNEIIFLGEFGLFDVALVFLRTQHRAQRRNQQ